MPRRFTIDQVRNIIDERSGERLLSEAYINSRTKIDILCKECNEPYNVRLCNYMDGSRCGKCSTKRSKKKITTERILDLCTKKNMTYISHHTLDKGIRVKYKCNKCDKLFDSAYVTFRKKKDCVCEKGGRKITYDFVKTFIENCDDTLVSTKYIKAKEPLFIKCKQCEKTFTTTWDNYQSGKRCPECNGSKTHTYDYVKSYIEKEGDILLSVKYVNCREKLQIKCGKCDEVINITFSHYQSGKRCRLCGIASAQESRRYSQNYIRAKLQYSGDTLLSEYYNHKTKMTIRCGACLKIFTMTYNDYRRGTRCSCYTISRGERYISNYLNHKGIEFSTEKKFENCRNIRKLPFDFFIEKYNLLIEFDGIQHFKPISQFGGEDGLLYTQRNDVIKNKFVLESDKKLLRISYNVLNRVEEILDDYLKRDTHEKIEYSSPEMYK